MALVYIKQSWILFFFCCALQARTVVVIAPHPDDDILGCGGTIVHHIKEGDKVYAVFMTSGERGGKKNNKLHMAQTREFEAIQAEKILGCNHCVFLRNPDGKLKKTEQVIDQVANCIKQCGADCVYIPHKHDNHKDHTMTYHIVLAVLQLLQQPRPIVYCYEVWTPLQHFTRVENISDVMALKLSALSKHASQLRSLSYDKAIEGLNRYRGIMSRKKAKYAECFYQLSDADIQAESSLLVSD